MLASQEDQAGRTPPALTPQPSGRPRPDEAGPGVHQSKRLFRGSEHGCRRCNAWQRLLLASWTGRGGPLRPGLHIR